MPARPRVLILVKGLDTGGAETLIAELLEQRDRTTFEYEVAYVRNGMDALVPRVAACVPVHCLGANGNADLSWLPRLRALLMPPRPTFQILHAHLGSSAALGRLVAKSLPPARRPRLVYTEHSSWPRLDVRTRMLMRLTSRLDDATFAVSAANRSLLPRAQRRRSVVLVHGIDLDRFTAQPDVSSVRRELRIPDGHLLVVTTASLTRQKDYPNLLQATRLLVDLPITVVAAGTGPLGADLAREHERLCLGDHFRFLGRRDDVPRLLRGADAFVLASAWESMPVAVMEATAAGLPSVLTSVGEIPAVLRNGRDALLVPPGSPTALAAALARLVDDATLRQSLGQAAKVAAGQFDIRRTVSTVERTYLGLAA